MVIRAQILRPSFSGAPKTVPPAPTRFLDYSKAMWRISSAFWQTTVCDALKAFDNRLELMEGLEVGVHLEHALVQVSEDIVGFTLHLVHLSRQTNRFAQIGSPLPLRRLAVP
jgi:hypothetical protein